MSLALESCTPLIEVFDMPTSVAFYRDLLGFEVVAQSQPGDQFDWGLLRLGMIELMLNTAYEAHERPPAPDPARVLAHRDTTLFFGCRDLDAAYAFVRARGLDVKEPTVTAYGMKQLWLRDPDGYALCFQHREQESP
jgi:catechol 2,3-dioxygenase-like lactoylglutathione lyase family enzyme